MNSRKTLQRGYRPGAPDVSLANLRDLQPTTGSPRAGAAGSGGHRKNKPSRFVEREYAETLSELHVTHATETKFALARGEARALNNLNHTHARTSAGARGVAFRIAKRDGLRMLFTPDFASSRVKERKPAQLSLVISNFYKFMIFLLSEAFNLKISSSIYVNDTMAAIYGLDWRHTMLTFDLRHPTIVSLREYLFGGVDGHDYSRDLMLLLRNVSTPVGKAGKSFVTFLEGCRDYVNFLIEENIESTSLRMSSALRILLLIAGIEPNPGPTSSDDKTKVTTSSKSAPRIDAGTPAPVSPQMLPKDKGVKQQPSGVKQSDAKSTATASPAKQVTAATNTSSALPAKQTVGANDQRSGTSSTASSQQPSSAVKTNPSAATPSGAINTSPTQQPAATVTMVVQQPQPQVQGKKGQAGNSSQKKSKSGKVNRSNKRMAAIGRSFCDAFAQLGGAADARRDKEMDLAEGDESDDSGLASSVSGKEIAALKEKIISLEEANRTAMSDILTLNAIRDQAERQGFIPKDPGTVVQTFGFHGCYRPGMNSTFTEDDPWVTVNVNSKGEWRSDAFPVFYLLTMDDTMLAVASTTVGCSDMNLRYKNVYNGLVQSPDVKKYVSKLSTLDRLKFLQTMEARAFLLTGSLTAGGRCRWLNACEEWVPHKYTVAAPSDWHKRLKDKVFFADDMLKFQSSTARNSRAAPYIIDGLIPHVPDASDLNTLIAGLCKRLFPDLPARDEDVLAELEDLADDFCDYADTIIQSEALVFDDNLLDQLISEALEGRPLSEREQILEGVRMSKIDPDGAIELYNKTPYKCFIKLESYPDGTFKPPRFIMSLPLKCRGIQLCFMSYVLHCVEVATRECNVKHLTADEITEKLKHKFENVGQVAETDFSSFESCIGPDLKSSVENRIFRHFAPDQFTTDFIDDCMDRDEVVVIGPCFHCPKFHHIRMSGDYWTSLGNLLENIILISYATGLDVKDIMRDGLFEGDDGCFPAPEDPQAVIARSVKAGVKLTFAIAPWKALSFCGNHFEEVDGELVRFRDKHKALANSTILFNAPRSSTKLDRMLQRSKCVGYLGGPVIPDAFVFWAVVERFSRDARVDESKLLRMGLTKPYSSYGVESCVPDYLSGIPMDDDELFCKTVYLRNQRAGGECSLSTVRDMCRLARKAGPGASHVVLPCPFAIANSGSFYARDGSVFTHKEKNSLGYISVRYNDVQSRDVVDTDVVPVLSRGQPESNGSHVLTHTCELTRKESFNNFMVIFGFPMLIIGSIAMFWHVYSNTSFLANVHSVVREFADFIPTFPVAQAADIDYSVLNFTDLASNNYYATYDLTAKCFDDEEPSFDYFSWCMTAPDDIREAICMCYDLPNVRNVIYDDAVDWFRHYFGDAVASLYSPILWFVIIGQLWLVLVPSPYMFVQFTLNNCRLVLFRSWFGLGFTLWSSNHNWFLPFMIPYIFWLPWWHMPDVMLVLSPGLAVYLTLITLSELGLLPRRA